MECIAVNLKGNQLALQNCLFLPINMAKDPNATVHVKIKERQIKCRFMQTIQKPNIGASKIMREYLSIDMTHAFKVEPAEPLNQKDYGIKKLTIELSVRKNHDQMQQYSEKRVLAHLRDKETGYVLNLDQPLYIDVNTVIFQAIVKKIAVGKKMANYGVLIPNTQIQVISNINTPKQKQTLTETSSQSSQPNSLFKAGFKAEDMGIGGLDKELFNIFRRTFASRRFSNEVVDKFGVKHVKGILLYGPPGTGKTLIARQLAKALDIKTQNLKIVNGPEIFSRFVGQSESNIRKLFQRARQDENKLGPKSPLHIIVFDEIDAICKQRGIYSGGTNVTDQVVNQLLSNIDGVEALNNIVVIGMTNRKDLLDEAILRPGRFEVHIQVHLPNKQGRQQILNIHTAKLKNSKILDKQCKIQQLARLTKNFTGAEIQALVKCASSFTITRSTNIMNFSQKLKIDQANLKVKMEDFLKALDQVKPQFGVDQSKFSTYFREATINYGGSYDQLLNSLSETAQMTENRGGQIKSVLLYGPTGSGKTNLAVNFAKRCTFPYIKIIAPELFIGQSDSSKIMAINKIFQDAYKTTRACIVIDSFQRLIEYTAIGRRFSNNILQTLLVLISKIPPNSQTNLLIIGTTSMVGHMGQFDLPNSFHNKIFIPYLEQQETMNYIAQKINIDEKLAANITKVIFSAINKNDEGKNKKRNRGISIRGLNQIIGMVDNYSDMRDWEECYGLLTATGDEQIDVQ